MKKTEHDFKIFPTKYEPAVMFCKPGSLSYCMKCKKDIRKVLEECKSEV